MRKISTLAIFMALCLTTDIVQAQCGILSRFRARRSCQVQCRDGLLSRIRSTRTCDTTCNTTCNVCDSSTSVTHYDPDWRTKLLEVAKCREQTEAHILQSAQEQQEFIDSVRALGFRQSVYSLSSYNPYAVTTQGSTLYGYGFRELVDTYKNIDLSALYNQALRLRADSAAYESQATGEVHDLLDSLGDRTAAIAEIQARGQAAANTLKASGIAEAKVQKTGGIVQKTTIAKTEYFSGKMSNQKAQKVIKDRCASCHNSEKSSGGLDLSSPDALTSETARNVLQRVTSDDPQERMPLAKDMSPGQPLGVDELAALFMSVYKPLE